MSTPRLSALIIAKSIAEEFSDAESIGGVVAEILAAAELFDAFLSGHEIMFEEDEDAEAETEAPADEADETGMLS